MKKRKERKPVLKVPNRFERDFGHLSKSKKEKIISYLRTFMKKIRRYSEISTPEFQHVCPGKGTECHSCAFNPLTDKLKGFPPTAYGLLWALQKDKLFLCHGHDPKWKQNVVDLNLKLHFCVNWFSVKTRFQKEVKELV